MDFLLGIFTGITLSLAYGNHLIRQRKKKEQEERGRSLENVRKLWSAIRITPEDMQYLNSNPPPYPTEILKGQTARPFTFQGLFTPDYEYLKAQLQDAIERDDFEEAARLRDLINKK